MVRNSEKPNKKEERNGGGSKNKLDDDLEELFKLPLSEFTAARNSLAARLKKSGRGDEADFAKTLVKPSITAWTVNQLYWQHREAFDRLIATGERFRQAQTSRQASKVADMRESFNARRKELSKLSDLSTTLLRDAGHNPSPDTILRISTTLEAMSAYASVLDGPRPGRLTHDVDPPGFESLASFVPSAGSKNAVTSSQKSDRAVANTSRKAEIASEVRKLEDSRQARLAAAKTSLQDAKKLLVEVSATAKSLEAAQKKVSATAKEAEKERRQAEERLAQAKAASEDATREAQSIALEVDEASKALHDAKRAVEQASKDLEKLFRESTSK